MADGGCRSGFCRCPLKPSVIKGVEVDLETMNCWIQRYGLLVNRIEVINGYDCSGNLRLKFGDGRICIWCGMDNVMSFKVYSFEDLDNAIEYFSAWSDCLWYMYKNHTHLRNAV